MALTAEELLNSLSLSDVDIYAPNSSAEEHIVIGEDRYIVIPDALKRVAVQYDHNIETVTFDCPRYWDLHDMSKMKIYINYIRPDGVLGVYIARNVHVDEKDTNLMHFDWTITRNVTEVKGELKFLVCIKKVDGTSIETNHWNSELCDDMYISEGMECQEVVLEDYPDLVTGLLLRMDEVEAIATPEAMQKYTNEYIINNPEVIKKHIYDFMSELEPYSPEAMKGYVDDYLDKYPPLLVIGPKKPGISCLWFDTSGSQSSDSEPTVLKLISDTEGGEIYAEVEGQTAPVYNFDII